MADLPKVILDTLKTILPNPEIKGNKILSGGDTFNITININSFPAEKEKVKFDAAQKVIEVNDAALTQNEQNELDKYLLESINPDEPIIYKQSKVLLNEYETSSSSSGTVDTMAYLSGKIPDEDLCIWNEALFCKNIFDEQIKTKDVKKRTALQIKQKYVRAGIIRKYGSKGGNISNLCTAGYVDTWIKLLWESISKFDPAIPEKKQIEKFREAYSILVNHLGITIFVSEIKNQEIIYKEFFQKMIYTDIVNIHGIGKKNIATIEAVKTKIAGNKDFTIVTSKCDHNIMLLVILKTAKEQKAQ